MTVTADDLFCGAGGSGLGFEMAGGRLRLGINHWDRAVETHATNFQHADHDCADISALTTAQIRRYITGSDLLIAGTECTNHSLAKGARRRKPQAASLLDDGPAGDAEQDRSRATMWDVVRFAEQALLKGRPYKAIVVENVVDAFKWGADDNGGLFSAWLLALDALGYEHEIVWLNSMFCPPTPESRDRMYVVCWRRGIRRPNLRVEPAAWCPSCERIVCGRQTWKKPGARVWGRYGAQYFYGCPDCHRTVLPGAFPAASIIDPTLPAIAIGERARPLAANTRERIRRGLQRLAAEPFAIRLTHGGAPRPLTLPLVTLTRRHDPAMVFPVAANTFERTPGNRARDARTTPLDTVNATADRAIVVPAMGAAAARDAATHPAPSQTTTTRAVLVMANTQNGVPRPADRSSAQTLRTEGGLAMITTGHKGADGTPDGNAGRDPARTLNIPQALVYANRANNTPRPAGEHPAQALCTGGHLGVVVAHYDPGWARRADDQPTGTVTSRDGHSLVVPYHRTAEPTPAGEAPSGTLTIRDRAALLVPAGGTWASEPTLGREPVPTQTGREAPGVVFTDEDIDACLFRMFSLGEIADAMAMGQHVDGSAYVVLGNKREGWRSTGKPSRRPP